jgi:lipopolysaccharide/colanic/teichoic acid biosynthesis glycosyltransferase
MIRDKLDRRERSHLRTVTQSPERGPGTDLLRSRSQPSRFYQNYGKRIFDVAVSLLLLILFAPAILVLGVLVAVTSGWPAFYGSARVGRNGPFKMWKLRSMVKDADLLLERWRAEGAGIVYNFDREFKIDDDPRVTKLGRILRRTSLDELPQFWNVLRGEMSLVGPRPLCADEVALYGDRRFELLSFRPGITGEWQVNGRGHITYPDRMYVELDYCANMTFMGDVKLLLQTLVVPFKSEGA